MILTVDHLLEAFLLLEACGYRTPPALGDDLERGAAVWAAMLEDMTPAELQASLKLYMTDATAFWPTPGQLLQRLPRRRLDELDDSDSAWGQVNRMVCSSPGSREMERMEREGEAWVDDPDRDALLKAAVQACGGARAIGHSQEGNTYMQHRFVSSWRTLKTRRRIDSDAESVSRLTSSGGLLRLAESTD